MWGELASHKRLFNPPSQFSRLGIQVSYYSFFPVLIMYIMCIVCLGYLSFFPTSAMLVCYAHVFPCTVLSTCPKKVNRSTGTANGANGTTIYCSGTYKVRFGYSQSTAEVLYQYRTFTVLLPLGTGTSVYFLNAYCTCMYV